MSDESAADRANSDGLYVGSRMGLDGYASRYRSKELVPSSAPMPMSRQGANVLVNMPEHHEIPNVLSLRELAAVQ